MEIPFDLALTKVGNGGTQGVSFYTYATSEHMENITNWALKQFQKKYKDKTITKEEIFHYVYSVLHHPVYCEKYEINLTREFPRIPFYENFRQWATWGKQLMDLHLNYKTVKPYPLKREDIDPESTRKAYKATLRAREESGTIEIDTYTKLSGIPAESWKYIIGRYSALRWILECYKEKKPRDPTIREKFNTYRFADYKEQVIDLLMRVCTVSVETMKIVKEMPE
jgi:predicted helicase